MTQKMSSEILRPHSQLKDGSQLIQIAQTGVHRSPFSLNTLASTLARTVPGGGFVWNSSTLRCGFKHTWMNRRCKAEAQQKSKTFLIINLETQYLQVIEA